MRRDSRGRARLTIPTRARLKSPSLPGYVGNLTLKVPWKSLKTEPVVVVLDQVFALAQPRAATTVRARPAVCGPERGWGGGVATVMPATAQPKAVLMLAGPLSFSSTRVRAL